MTSKACVSALCPSCQQPLIQDERTLVCPGCDYAVMFSNVGDWFYVMACFRREADEAELERLHEMLRLWSDHDSAN